MLSFLFSFFVSFVSGLETFMVCCLLFSPTFYFIYPLSSSLVFAIIISAWFLLPFVKAFLSFYFLSLFFSISFSSYCSSFFSSSKMFLLPNCITSSILVYFFVKQTIDWETTLFVGAYGTNELLRAVWFNFSDLLNSLSFIELLIWEF